MFSYNTSSDSKAGGPGNCATRKLPWQSAQLRYLGHVTEIVQGGGGKLSTTGGDPGESKKQQGGAG